MQNKNDKSAASVTGASPQSLPMQAILLTELALPDNSLSVVAGMGVTSVEMLCQLTPNEIMHAAGSNEQMMKDIEAALEQRGLTLHSEI